MATIRFRKRLRLTSWLALNVGKRGASLSMGPRGAHLTVGPRGGQASIGLPGSGVSIQQRFKTPRPRYLPKARDEHDPGYLADEPARPSFFMRLLKFFFEALALGWALGMAYLLADYIGRLST